MDNHSNSSQTELEPDAKKMKIEMIDIKHENEKLKLENNILKLTHENEKTRKELNNTKGKLESTAKELDHTKEELNNTKGKIDNFKGVLEYKKGEFDNTKWELEETKKKLENSIRELENVKSKLNGKMGEFENMKKELESYQIANNKNPDTHQSSLQLCNEASAKYISNRERFTEGIERFIEGVEPKTNLYESYSQWYDDIFERIEKQHIHPKYILLKSSLQYTSSFSSSIYHQLNPYQDGRGNISIETNSLEEGFTERNTKLVCILHPTNPQKCFEFEYGREIITNKSHGEGERYLAGYLWYSQLSDPKKYAKDNEHFILCAIKQ